MTSSSAQPPESQRGFQSLVISILLLLVLVADPRLFLERIPHVRDLGMDFLKQARLWLVCLAVCFTITRLIELVLHRRIRKAWVYILVWAAVIPPAYGLFVGELERRWPGRGEHDVLLLTAMAVVTAFAGTMLKRLADSVTRTVQYDHLTGLPNRAFLSNRLTRDIERAKRRNEKLAVCMINIDRFKRINDSIGHTGGDVVLVNAAKQLQDVAGASNTVARIGGDEFVVLMPDFGTFEELEQSTQRMLDALAQPMTVGNREVCVTASLGLCVYPDDADDAAALLHGADRAMVEVKHAGHASLPAYSPSTQSKRADRLELEEDFRHALENNELSLHYQPQVQLATGKVNGLEALLRWNNPKRGSVPPSDFIAIAEEVGLMIPVGKWALQQCCLDCVELQKATGLPLTVALNLSARQFSQRGMPALVEQTLVATGLAPQHLELEITEQMLMVNSPEILETLQAIRNLGVGTAIDDFGTGFSSFAYILQYHVDRIKIDQSFVARATQNPNATAVVRTIIAMAHGLNMKVVAEGVESIEQVEFLIRRRCDDAQGYLFGRPVPKDEVAAAVRHIVSEMRQRLSGEGLQLADFNMPLDAQQLQ